MSDCNHDNSFLWLVVLVAVWIGWGSLGVVIKRLDRVEKQLDLPSINETVEEIEK